MKKNARLKNPDYVFISAIFFLTAVGLLILSSASSEIGKVRFDDTYYYLKHQIMSGVLVGLIGFLIFYFAPLHKLRKISLPLFLMTVLGLIAVFTPLGFSAGGATRWINIGGFTMQPAELLKLTFILYLAAWFSRSVKVRKSFKEGFLPYMGLCAIVSGLLFIQPTTSTAVIVLAGTLAMYFVGGGRILFISLAILVGVAVLAGLIYVSPYRRARVASYLDPATDPLGSGYQRNQALIAMGSGGLFGVGYGNSISKYTYLPEPITDSIFAIIGEEFGFMGATVLISAFMLLFVRMFRISARAPDLFSRMAVVGIATIVALQAFINIAAISGLLPLTGVPLPFISYGGTALAILLASMGLIANVSRYG